VEMDGRSVIYISASSMSWSWPTPSASTKPRQRISGGGLPAAHPALHDAAAQSALHAITRGKKLVVVVEASRRWPSRSKTTKCRNASPCSGNGLRRLVQGGENNDPVSEDAGRLEAGRLEAGRLGGYTR